MFVSFRSYLLAPLLGAAALPGLAQPTTNYTASAGARHTLGMAVESMEAGRFREATHLLDSAETLAPGWQAIAYERAFWYYIQREYGPTVKLGEALILREDAEPEAYQLLGNAYDYSDRRKKAVAIYDAGLKRFPTAGQLYLERGTVELTEKRYDAAREYFEKGIDVAPEYPPNYLRVARLYLNSDQEVWGLLYGEIFLNMERNSERAGLMGKMLYDTYRSEIKPRGDSGASVSLSSNTIRLTKDQLKKKNSDALKESLLMLDLSGFGHQYEVLVGRAAHGEAVIDLAALHRIRTRVLDDYYAGGLDEKFPNLLFEYQRKVQQAGHLEAYNYWTLRQGEEATFKAWRKANPMEWEAFTQWYGRHPLEVTLASHFHRKQYQPATGTAPNATEAATQRKN